MVDNPLLQGNLSKIKNQFVQKSGHLMASNYIKEVERQVNNLSAYQSETYHNGSGNKHRDISNYSNTSQYNKNLKQTSSSGHSMVM